MSHRKTDLGIPVPLKSAKVVLACVAARFQAGKVISVGAFRSAVGIESAQECSFVRRRELEPSAEEDKPTVGLGSMKSNYWPVSDRWFKLKQPREHPPRRHGPLSIVPIPLIIFQP